MPVDLTELLESVPAPPMHVDADAVLTRGRRRRLRRRLGGAAAVLGAAALIVPVADALRVDGSPPAVPAVPAAPAPQDCLFPGQGARSWWSNTAGSGRMTGTPWLDSGAPDGDRTVRVQVNTDTCHGLAVAVSNGTEGGVTTADLAGPPQHAFWVFEAFGGGINKFGNAMPVKPTAVVLLPQGQQVCGISSVSPVPTKGRPPALSEERTTAAGHQWQATIATIADIDNPQSSAVLKICEGDRVVEPTLRPLNVIPAPAATPSD